MEKCDFLNYPAHKIRIEEGKKTKKSYRMMEDLDLNHLQRCTEPLLVRNDGRCAALSSYSNKHNSYNSNNYHLHSFTLKESGLNSSPSPKHKKGEEIKHNTHHLQTCDASNAHNQASGGEHYIISDLLLRSYLDETTAQAFLNTERHWMMKGDAMLQELCRKSLENPFHDNNPTGSLGRKHGDVDVDALSEVQDSTTGFSRWRENADRQKQFDCIHSLRKKIQASEDENKRLREQLDQQNSDRINSLQNSDRSAAASAEDIAEKSREIKRLQQALKVSMSSEKNLAREVLVLRARLSAVTAAGGAFSTELTTSPYYPTAAHPCNGVQREEVELRGSRASFSRSRSSNSSVRRSGSSHSDSSNNNSDDGHNSADERNSPTRQYRMNVSQKREQQSLPHPQHQQAMSVPAPTGLSATAAPTSFPTTALHHRIPNQSKNTDSNKKNGGHLNNNTANDQKNDRTKHPISLPNQHRTTPQPRKTAFQPASGAICATTVPPRSQTSTVTRASPPSKAVTTVGKTKKVDTTSSKAFSPAANDIPQVARTKDSPSPHAKNAAAVKVTPKRTQPPSTTKVNTSTFYRYNSGFSRNKRTTPLSLYSSSGVNTAHAQQHQAAMKTANVNPPKKKAAFSKHTTNNDRKENNNFVITYDGSSSTHNSLSSPGVGTAAAAAAVHLSSQPRTTRSKTAPLVPSAASLGVSSTVQQQRQATPPMNQTCASKIFFCQRSSGSSRPAAVARTSTNDAVGAKDETTENTNKLVKNIATCERARLRAPVNEILPHKRNGNASTLTLSTRNATDANSFSSSAKTSIVALKGTKRARMTLPASRHQKINVSSPGINTTLDDVAKNDSAANSTSASTPSGSSSGGSGIAWVATVN